MSSSAQTLSLWPAEDKTVAYGWPLVAASGWLSEIWALFPSWCVFLSGFLSTCSITRCKQTPWSQVLDENVQLAHITKHLSIVHELWQNKAALFLYLEHVWVDKQKTTVTLAQFFHICTDTPAGTILSSGLWEQFHFIILVHNGFILPPESKKEKKATKDNCWGNTQRILH